MKSISTILFLLLAYAFMFILVVRVNKLRPHIFLYTKLDPHNLALLNKVHTLSMMIMLTPFLFIHHIPLPLFAFPGNITLTQSIAFLGCFGIIGFSPWNKFASNTFEKGTVSWIDGSLYCSLRVIFLIIYECFLRGMVLMSFSARMGISWAIIVNILLYVLLHVNKNKKEIIGCIPLGLLLCLFTNWWQSVWPAIIFHLQIAIINEWPPVKQFISPQKQAAL